MKESRYSLKKCCCSSRTSCYSLRLKGRTYGARPIWRFRRTSEKVPEGDVERLSVVKKGDETIWRQRNVGLALFNRNGTTVFHGILRRGDIHRELSDGWGEPGDERLARSTVVHNVDGAGRVLFIEKNGALELGLIAFERYGVDVYGSGRQLLDIEKAL